MKHDTTNATQAISGSMKPPEIRFKVSLNPTANHAQAMAAIATVCSALDKLDQSTEYLRVLLGRMLAEVQDRKLYEPAYESFEAYTQFLAGNYRLSRPTLRNALMIVRNLPGLEPEDAENMPLTNLTLAARAAKDAKPKAITAMLRDAAALNISEFRAKLEESGKIGKRGRSADSETVIIHIKVSAVVGKTWRDLVGTQDAGEVFAKLIGSTGRKRAA